jgi:integrase
VSSSSRSSTTAEPATTGCIRCGSSSPTTGRRRAEALALR